MSHFAAVLDANVLYNYSLTCVLLELAEARLYRPIWSQDIHAEWMRAVRRTRPDLSEDSIARRRSMMDAALPESNVKGYSRLIEGLALPDPGDRHVLAVAIRAKAQVIVTYNGRDFPAEVLDEFDLVAQHPDTFLRHLIDLSPNFVGARLRQMIAGFKRPPMSIDSYITLLERQSLPESAAVLRELLIDR